MNDWAAQEARKHYVRQMRWDKFRNFMAYTFWPGLIILAFLWPWR
jgi:hypothetical protein